MVGGGQMAVFTWKQKQMDSVIKTVSTIWDRMCGIGKLKAIRFEADGNAKNLEDFRVCVIGEDQDAKGKTVYNFWWIKIIWSADNPIVYLDSLLAIPETEPWQTYNYDAEKAECDSHCPGYIYYEFKPE